MYFVPCHTPPFQPGKNTNMNGKSNTQHQHYLKTLCLDSTSLVFMNENNNLQLSPLAFMCSQK